MVTHLKEPFKPQEFKDSYRANVEQLIEQKQKGQKIKGVKQRRKAPVLDLMEALKRSLKAAPPRRLPRRKRTRRLKPDTIKAER